MRTTSSTGRCCAPGSVYWSAGASRDPGSVVTLVTGIGAVLAIGWELGEWYTFIRHGTELDTAYTDTLGDEALGTLGALLAGVVLATRGRLSVSG